MTTTIIGLFDGFSEAQRLIHTLVAQGVRTDRLTSMDLIDAGLCALSGLLALQGKGISGIPTHFNDLDELTSGIQPGHRGRASCGRRRTTCSSARRRWPSPSGSVRPSWPASAPASCSST
mgnify:CR=1 FL=1